MILPERIDKHITETSSYKIFSCEIPDSWIIREVTERDYGIDCYIEVVNNRNQVTGELISIQLKGTKGGINWTREDYYTFSGIKISTTNYWNNFPTPVFICLVDIDSREVYFCPVKSSIRKNIVEYDRQQTFSYKIQKNNRLTLSCIGYFLDKYYKEKDLDILEKQIITFISNYPQYRDFIDSNTGRDVFLGIDYDRILFLQHFYNNLKYLCDNFDLEWNILNISEYQAISVAKFGNHYPLYEMEMDEIVTKLEEKMNPLVLKIKDLMWSDEKDFWLRKNNELFNVVTNANDDGTINAGW